MRIGIFSDVHSNIEALTAVREELEALGCDRLICLGDVVGYGASPNECARQIREMAAVTLLGNHDAAVAGKMDYSFYYEAARHALDWTAEKLEPENLAWLQGLPYVHREGEVGFCHGSPLEPEAYEYIFAEHQARELLPVIDELADITFIGHSHLCKAFALRDGEVHDVIAQRFTVREGYRYICSVGSVGQPRDYDNRSCFVTYDTEKRLVQYHRVEYDIDAAAQRIFDEGLAANFGKRLFLGV
ncbi:metallophosphoesterase family protein [Vulgatibacter sp.]|uniref:metallophosphoesterase family protein n=1 Tax=Vulgatibacter sp. TaxID=1971226 RepID=UPI003569A250